MISTLAANDNIAFVGHDPTHAPDGYYLARTLGPAYELDADISRHAAYTPPADTTRPVRLDEEKRLQTTCTTDCCWGKGGQMHLQPSSMPEVLTTACAGASSCCPAHAERPLGDPGAC